MGEEEGFVLDGFNFDSVELDADNLEDVLNKVNDIEDTEVPPSDKGKVDEDVDDEETTDDEEEIIEDKDKNSSNFYSLLTSTLKEGGIFENIEEEKIPKNLDEFKELFKTTVKEKEFSDLTQEQKYFLEAIRTGIPEQQALQNLQVENQLTSITDSDIEEDEELRQNIIINYLQIKGLDEDDIKKQLKRSIDLGDDVDDAKKYKEKLVQHVNSVKAKEIEDAKENIKLLEQKRKEDAENLKSLIEGTKEIIPGFEIDSKMKKSIYESIVTPHKEIEGKKFNKVFAYINENPVESQIKLSYLYEITNGFKDMNKLVTGKVRTKVVKDLEEKLQQVGRRELQGSVDRDLDDSVYSDISKMKIVL